VSIKFYSYSSCSTCRKAKNWLEENSILFEMISIVDNPPSREIINSAISQIEDRKLIFNTSGKSYRELGAVVVKSLTNEEAVEALFNDGKLLKRPFLVDESGRVLIGFKVDLWKKFFKV
tara:strand:+ start:411 stop:767 length:357 start_codon:yes stop_codon:yes gene_type:complete